MSCPTCGGPCQTTTTGIPMSRDDVIDDVRLCQERCRKARREGKYFRAEKWAQRRDVLLDHLTRTP